MEGILQLFTLILWLISFVEAEIHTISIKENTAYRDKVSTEHLIGEYHNSNLKRCTNDCLMKSDCMSLFYQKQTERCRLYRIEVFVAMNAGMDVNLTTSVGWRYYGQINSSCFTGWESDSDHFYCFMNFPVTWDGAKTFCQNIGGYLATVNSAWENSWITSRKTSGLWWIGFNDLSTEGEWQWISGSTGQVYTKWRSDQPNGNTGSNCAAVDRSGDWLDRSCTSLCPFICEK